MPEVGGELVDYFSPYDSGECLNQIVSYLDPKTIKQKSDRIAREYTLHSWDDSFEQFESNISKVK
jgi:hypothetical protein